MGWITYLGGSHHWRIWFLPSSATLNRESGHDLNVVFIMYETFKNQEKWKMIKRTETHNNSTVKGAHKINIEYYKVLL